MKPLSIVFIGTSEYALPALESLSKSEFWRPRLVISQPDRPQGRKLLLKPSPVSELAKELALDLITPPDINASEIRARISAEKPDLLITASYGAMIGRELRKSATLGAINLHPSLLPKYRGASPIQTALLNGDCKTGITIFRLSGSMDAGDILLQKSVYIFPDDNFTSLHDHLARLSAELLTEYLCRLDTNPPVPQKQDKDAATYTRKIEKDDLNIDWNSDSTLIVNKVRALSEIPGAFTTYQGKVLKILGAEVSSKKSLDKPGVVQDIVKNVGFCVNTADKQIMIKKVQATGKKAMTAAEWQIGSRITAGEVLGSEYERTLF